MKNFIVFFIAVFLFSCKKEEPVIMAEDTPPTLTRFWVNFAAADPNGGTITLGINEPFRIDFIAIDEGELRDFSSYFLLNNDEGEKYFLSRRDDIRNNEFSYGTTFSDGFRWLLMENGEKRYDLKEGDELHFYAFVSDDTGNTTSMNVVIILTE